MDFWNPPLNGFAKESPQELQFMDFFLDGLKFQSSELSPPWLSAAGAFFFQMFAFFICWIHFC